MSTLTFRNLRGDIVDIPLVPASIMKSKFGAVLDQATQAGAVAITKHDTTKYVLLPVEEFESLVATCQPSLSTLTVEFDNLLAKMQTPQARTGIQSAFAMSPKQLGKAAVQAASGKR
ncbi:MAG: type II toxin-antitoxin system prevent-host-death family antitoxin [Betaproteobacteria bacterium]